MLDTLAIAQKLRGAGFSDVQAEALASAVQQAAGIPDTSDLATKTDLTGTMAALKSDIALLKAEMKADIAELKADLQSWIINLVFGAVILNAIVVVGTMVALVKLLGR